jgi:ribose transport system permease protein
MTLLQPSAEHPDNEGEVHGAAFWAAVAAGGVVAAALVYWFGSWGLLLDLLLLAAARYRIGPRLAVLTTALGPFLALSLVLLFFVAAEFTLELWRAWARTDFDFLDFWSDHQSTFWSVRNGRTVLVQSSVVAVAALGMTVVIIAGGIDLSAGTALALCAISLAWCLRADLHPLVACLACVGTGLAAGMVNGPLVCLLRLPPFIVTLGTMTIYLGMGKMMAGETTLEPPREVIPQWLPALVRPQPDPPWLLVPAGVWLALGLALVMAAVLKFTVLGRHLFAIGSNESTARLCGINVNRTKLIAYGLCGLFIGTAGIYQFARLQIGSPNSGIGLELRIIAAVVIGGGSLSGGRGSILGTLAGAGIMQAISSGCTLLGLSNPVQDIVIGLIIVAAVTIDQLRQRRAER